MNAILCLPGRTRRTFHMPLSQFLQTRLVRERARRALCEPAELLAEHIYGDPRAADPRATGASVARQSLFSDWRRVRRRASPRRSRA